ncbi:vitronectin b [Larimichthys crocea]|uniref:vitronectin b n=1 Tax=Larimichthys crocea TaxID=215358 RepID=UPI000F5D81A5|nr:vitronectin [Larimichthys crocea]XP_010748366.2 vitronectin [Larimichthys crocea]XP_019128416.2 vitronectin [Larimichthys crocea]
MKPAVVLLGLVLLLETTFAAEESCVGHCGTFKPQRKCQCDSMCVYYGSCCGDFDVTCPKKVARGDTFEEVTEVGMAPIESATTFTPTFNAVPTEVVMTSVDGDTTPTLTSNTVPATFPSASTVRPTPPVNPDAVGCSGRPFDAFLQLKNGSIYAFRGDYFFELDDRSILPGYPKLIQDVWGISGPIDAAFTRINCQGKSYIFKGNQYWRFDGDVLDADYPRDISVGFDGIPNGVQAAFAIPAPSHRGKEKAYFFKGDQYYQYQFKHQPSHEECVRMTRSSPSVLFTQYTDLFCDQTWEDFFTELFGGATASSDYRGPRLISKDWQGLRPPIDAALVGRVYFSPKPTSPPPARRRSSRRKKPSKKRGRGRQSRHVFDDLWGYDDWFDYPDYSDIIDETTTQEYKTTPVQNVYFFKKDKYYRADLQTKHVDWVYPPYPRSIAKYWLGCKHEDAPDASRAEKR